MKKERKVSLSDGVARMGLLSDGTLYFDRH